MFKLTILSAYNSPRNLTCGLWVHTNLEDPISACLWIISKQIEIWLKYNVKYIIKYLIREPLVHEDYCSKIVFMSDNASHGLVNGTCSLLYIPLLTGHAVRLRAAQLVQKRHLRRHLAGYSLLAGLISDFYYWWWINMFRICRSSHCIIQPGKLGIITYLGVHSGRER